MSKRDRKKGTGAPPLAASVKRPSKAPPPAAAAASAAKAEAASTPVAKIKAPPPAKPVRKPAGSPKLQPEPIATPAPQQAAILQDLAASDAATVAPPAKRPRASSRPLPPLAEAPEAVGTSSGPGALTRVGPAASAEPTLEVAASIAVSSDRADSEPAARLARGSSNDRLREAAAFGSSQSLLSTDYYFRQYGARSLAAEVDDFGFDPHVDTKVRPLLEAVCKRYFRVELVGAENIPARGRALLVANRAGALPWDGLVLRTALRSQRPELSPLRWLAEDAVIHYPFMGVFMNRLGAVRACPENAERLLAQDRLVAVFPEGAQGSRKLFRDRYRLQRFGRGGYVKLALKLGVPIFPTAIIGAEEINPVLGRSRFLGRVFGSDSVPITPTFPWLGLAGLLPAPVRWRIAVGTPIDLSSYGPESADDALVVHRLNEQIRSSLQALVDQGKSARGSALFG
ncbi:MAG: acyltransferase family protein [Myxococcaceae bacterium]|nr:acyltransferase family protein [Myxococcaceae bacterium]